MSRQLRIEPYDAIASDREIRRIKNRAFDEVEHRAINLRTLWFHQIENEFRRSVAALVHNSNCRIITVRNCLDPHLAFQHRISVIEDRIDRVRRVAIARQVERRRSLPNRMPIVGNWLAACLSIGVEKGPPIGMEKGPLLIIGSGSSPESIGGTRA